MIEKWKEKKKFWLFAREEKMEGKEKVKGNKWNGPSIFFLSKLEKKWIRQKLLKYNYLFVLSFRTKQYI